ncbi:MAG TPA: TolC family protein [Thermoanaerobaculia bacterium]|nr:TolC family protein [Thermoanaerobaculia bacterium]
MKGFPKFRAGSAALLALACSGVAALSLAQTGPAISARPGERTPRPLPPPAGTEGIRLSLDEAVALAIANNQDLNVSVNAAEASRYTLFSNMGIFDPLAEAAVLRSHSEQPRTSQFTGAEVTRADTTNLSARVTQLAPTGGTFSLGFTGRRSSTNDIFFLVNPSWTTGLTLSASQPLLRNFGRDATTWLIRISRNSRDSSYQNFVRSVQTAVNLVEQAYWDLVYAIRNLAVKQEALVVARDLNRITRIKIDVGSLAPIDITQTEVGIATAEQDIIIAESLIGDAQDRLKRLLSFSPEQWTIPIIPTDEVRAEQATVDVEAGIKTAYERRPEIIVAQYNVDSDRIRYDFWRNQTRPQLDLVGTYGYAGLGGTTTLRDDAGNILSRERGGFSDAFQQILDRDFKNWSIGLNFSYPILNRSARGQRGAALYTWESNKALLSTIEQNVLLEVRTAARDIETAKRRIAAAQKSRELAERNLDAERKKFENGMTTSFQVNQIQNDLSAARSNELQALAVYRKALSAYHFAIADILEWKSIRVEDLPASEPPRPESRAPRVLAPAPPPAGQ